jgi:hypothetical protein
LAKVALPFFPLVLLDSTVGLRLCRAQCVRVSDRCFSGSRTFALAFSIIGPRKPNRLPTAYIKGGRGGGRPIILDKSLSCLLCA